MFQYKTPLGHYGLVLIFDCMRSYNKDPAQPTCIGILVLEHSAVNNVSIS